ncbi:hypothetical protein [Portibacter marinus]|uniref:hypothetical protein n=1 Tax=Portibacter marinus TaxID=2898660 RepID=UPI001F464363|nr:hypothetical protein [Portibacter marinus]
MEHLISLTDLLTRQKLHQINIIDELNNPNNKMTILYDAIASGEVKTDHDALALMYNGNGKLGTLNRLKNRLYKRLLNSIFFIDQSGPNYKDIFEAGKNSYKNYAAIKILLANRKRLVAIDLAKKTLKVTSKFEFTDLNYLLSSILTTHFASYTSNLKKYKSYRKKRDYYLKALSAEQEVEELYGYFGLTMMKNKTGVDSKFTEFHLQKIKEMRLLQKSIKTTRFNLYTFLYQANYYLEFSNYKSLIEVAQEGIAFYKKKGIKSVDADYTLRTREALGQFLSNNYAEAQNLFKKNLEITDPRTSNWFSTYNYLFATYINSELYLKAYEALSIVFSKEEFESTLPLLVQLFKIKEAYIHFLVELGKIDPEKSDQEPLRPFRLNRFLNDVPTYSKDKRGVNISILIIQMILLVQNKKHGQIIDRLDALNMYSHRYLRSDHTFRSNCFIKMLTKLPDADYHPIRWHRYVEKYRKRLDEHPFELSYHNLDLEVIPFETLYDLVIEMLEQQKGIAST